MLTIDATQANKVLAERVVPIVRSHPRDMPERRAAASLYAALVTTRTPEAARRALGTFADKATVTAASVLLDQIERETTDCHVTETP